jgi:lactate dehydrogenase-like 2-hydroxyacid dehydrogenase
MTRNKIWFCNTLDAVGEATASMAMYLILATVRDTYRAEKGAREGGWYNGVMPSLDTTDMTLGIVGMGTIGKYLAKRAAAFNMRIKYYNRNQLSADEEKKLSATYCSSLMQLLSEAEVVSLHCPLNKSTMGLMSTEQFAAMKDGSFLVNTSRGQVVEEDALIVALESGKLARAGLDVFCNEPNIKDYFRTSDKVICQPHMGGMTKVALKKAHRECFENVKALLETGRPFGPVNELNK